ncbi:GNAT family N-acetyltransferase [Pedobacter sp. SL55]|uniref:GNAT family N-acetyltransferase n=1 Tax=Pedobacter sp. SL55 TaxID=2995161 RepID=UPI00226F7778|nr:GNAT family N-acetyltransferase [Pedobacter sp. SL55]WAC38995.1 GNAT family N-acetyltransferase [Pedobacter sp. SL55]
MKEEFLNLPVIKNEETKRFELTVDGHTAFIDYEENEKTIKLIHTESPEALAGRGAATALIEKTLIYLEENKYELVPLCQLVFAYVKRHPEWKRLVPSKYLRLFDREDNN